MDFQSKFYCLSLIPTSHLCSKSCVETIYRKKFGGQSYMLEANLKLKCQKNLAEKKIRSNFIAWA